MSGLCGGVDDSRAGGHLVLGSGGGASFQARYPIGLGASNERDTSVVGRLVPVLLRSSEFSSLGLLLKGCPWVRFPLLADDSVEFI
jgi:hypothetical protein